MSCLLLDTKALVATAQADGQQRLAPRAVSETRRQL